MAEIETTETSPPARDWLSRWFEDEDGILEVRVPIDRTKAEARKIAVDRS